MVFVGAAITWMNKSTGSKHILDRHMNGNKQSRAGIAALKSCDQLGLECQNTRDQKMMTLKPMLSHHTTVGTQNGTRRENNHGVNKT